MDYFFLALTWLGSLLVLLPSGVAGVGLLRRVLTPADIGLIIGGLLGASVLTHILKLMVSRPRPVIVEDMIVAMPADFSFPSAHTAQAVSFFLALALVVNRTLPVKNGAVVWLFCVLIAALVGYSRIYLKVHYISDVVAGALLAIFWIMLLNWFIHSCFSGGGYA